MVKKGAPMGEVDRPWGRRAAHGGARLLGKKGRRELAPPLAILAAAARLAGAGEDEGKEFCGEGAGA